MQRLLLAAFAGLAAIAIVSLAILPFRARAASAQKATPAPAAKTTPVPATPAPATPAATPASTTQTPAPATPATAAAPASKITFSQCRVDGPYIAMTFDDGPHGVNTPRLLDMLKQRKIHATFFFVGQCVEEFPDIVK